MLFRSLLNWPHKVWNTLIWRVIPYCAFLVSFSRSYEQAVLNWPDTKPLLGPRVALFVHYDGNKIVRPYVLHYLARLQEAGLSVLFVSNAGELTAAAMETVKPFCSGILVRRNIGYDFTAMREGLEHFGLPRADTELLVIANDSVYGPLRPLDELLSRIDFDEADLWGATDSWQARYHLQSYFLAAGPALLRHPAWAAFWAQVRPVPSKRWVINKYEVGMTQWMLHAGLSVAALWPYQTVVQGIDESQLMGGPRDDRTETDPLVTVRRNHSRRLRVGYVNRIAQNPTSDMWRQLLVAGFPFLKRELVRDNPTCVSDIMDWRKVIAETSGADISMIERDLQRLDRNQAP
jgi:lipopolysaccharide biosynthesis protein